MAVFVIETQYNRAKIGTSAFGFGVAGDHRFEAVLDFHFQPFTAAPWFVQAVASFGEDSFQALAAGDFEEAFAIRNEMIRKPYRIAGGDEQVCECGLAALKGHATEVIAVEVKEVEDVIQDLDIRLGGDAAAAFAESGALLHQTERGAAVFV